MQGKGKVEKEEQQIKEGKERKTRETENEEAWKKKVKGTFSQYNFVYIKLQGFIQGQ